MRRILPFWQQKSASVMRSYLTHGAFITKMEKAGYPENDGICHGLSCEAAQFFLLQQMEKFDENLKLFAHHSDRRDRPPQHMYHFLNDIHVAQSQNDFPILLPHSHKPFQDTKQALTIIENEAIKKLGGIHSIDFFSSIYSVKEIAQIFKILRDASKNASHPYALIVSAVHHAVMVALDKSRSQWMVVDANRLPAKYYDNEKTLAIALHRAMITQRKKTDFSALSTHFLTTGHYKSDAKKIIFRYKNNAQWRELHTVTKQKATLKDSADTTWLMLACNENQLRDADLLIQQGAMIDVVNELDLTALSYAVGCGHEDMVRLLLENGALAFDADNSYMQSAAELGNLNIAEMLIRHGSPINIGSPSPVFLAAKNKHQPIIDLFAQYAEIGAGSCFAKNNSRLFGKKQRSTFDRASSKFIKSFVVKP